MSFFDFFVSFHIHILIKDSVHISFVVSLLLNSSASHPSISLAYKDFAFKSSNAKDQNYRFPIVISELHLYFRIEIGGNFHGAAAIISHDII
jgi:hypothetical protein